MKHLYFLRHGESEFNRSSIWTGDSDSPLTNDGEKQARQAGEEARKNNFMPDLIIASPLSRALNTAKSFSEIINYPIDKIMIDKRLIERDFGILDGKKQDVAETKYLHDESSIDEYEGVESLAHLQNRVDKFFEYLKTLDQDTILLIGHGAFARALRRSINKLPIHERGYKLHYAELVKFI